MCQSCIQSVYSREIQTAFLCRLCAQPLCVGHTKAGCRSRDKRAPSLNPGTNSNTPKNNSGKIFKGKFKSNTNEVMSSSADEPPEINLMFDNLVSWEKQ